MPVDVGTSLTGQFATMASTLFDALMQIQAWNPAAQGSYPGSADAINHQLFALLNVMVTLITFVVHLSPGM